MFPDPPEDRAKSAGWTPELTAICELIGGAQASNRSWALPVMSNRETWRAQCKLLAACTNPLLPICRQNPLHAKHRLDCVDLLTHGTINEIRPRYVYNGMMLAQQRGLLIGV